MKTTLAGVVMAVVVLLYAAPLFAHHSFAAEFDDKKPIVIKGRLTKVEMTNPHSWLYMSVKDVDNFLYREFEGEVIKIDDFYGGYTVINLDNNLNYARFDMSTDRAEFITRSLVAGVEARATREFINTGRDLTPREQKNNVYTTCMPWLDMRAIEHPIYEYKSADIPLIAWGRYSELGGDMMTVPFCVQAHHGFVDGYHVHLLLQRLGERIGLETSL